MDLLSVSVIDPYLRHRLVIWWSDPLVQGHRDGRRRWIPRCTDGGFQLKGIIFVRWARMLGTLASMWSIVVDAEAGEDAQGSPGP